MRLYDVRVVASGLLLILSTIDSALAAPVLAQEKRQAHDAVYIPREATTVSGKRGEEDLERLLKESFETVDKPESSHAGSSTAPPGSDHASGSTDVPVVHAQEPNPAPSTSNPNPLMGSTSPGSYSDSEELWTESDDEQEYHTILESSSGYDELHPGLPGARPPQLEPGPNPKKRPLTFPPWEGAGSDSDTDWEFLVNMEDPPPKRPALSKEFGVDVQQTDTDTGPSNPKLPTEPGGYEAVTAPPGPPDLVGSTKEPDDAIDPHDALYAAKGKSKELRHISGHARDIGNAAQRVAA